MGKRRHQFLYLLIISPIIAQYLPLNIRTPFYNITGGRLFTVIVAIAVFGVTIRETEITFTRTDLGLIFVLLALIVSTAWSVAPGESARRSTDLLFPLLYFAALVLYFDEPDDLWKMSYGLFLTAIILATSGLAILVSDQRLVYGVLAETRNEYSRVLIATFPFAVVGAIAYRGVRRAVAVAASVAILVLIPAAGSRSGMGAFAGTAVLVLIAVLYLETDTSPSQIAAVSIAAVTGLVAVVWLGVAFNLLPQRLATIPMILRNPSPELIGVKRYNIYRAQLAALREYWSTGMGFGGFHYWTEHVYGIGSHRPHDMLSRIWLAAGIIPLTVFLVTYLFIVRNYVRFIANHDGWPQLWAVTAFIGLVGITVAGMLNIVINELAFYLLLAIGSNLLPKFSHAEA